MVLAGRLTCPTCWREFPIVRGIPRFVAVDTSGVVEAAQANVAAPIHIAQASLLRLPFRPGTFDAIYCFGVIQYTPDPRATMSA